MKGQNLSRTLLFLVILTFITVFSWIGFSLFRTFSQPSPLQIPPSQLEPLTPSLDTEVLEKLTKRRIFTQEPSSIINNKTNKND